MGNGDRQCGQAGVVRLGEQIVPPGRRPEPLNDARQFPIWVDQGARIDGGNSTILVEFAAQAVAHGVEELLDGE